MVTKPKMLCYISLSQAYTILEGMEKNDLTQKRLLYY